MLARTHDDYLESHLELWDRSDPNGYAHHMTTDPLPLTPAQLAAFIRSEIAKWALLAPIFIPLFIRLNVAPQTVLAAYRVGDSPANVITPLMAYFPLIVVFAQRYETHEAVTLAFLTALHRLPPRQRAVLVLRDVLGFSATEVAAMLDTTRTSVNSALIRARATIEEREPRAHDRAPVPRSAQEHELVARFADAFERGDVEPIVALLAEDACWTMPPEPHEYQGHEAIKELIAHAFATRGAGISEL